jgi:hypothetical protein
MLSAAAIFAGTVAEPRVDQNKIVCTVQDTDGVGPHYPRRGNRDPREAREDE